MGKQITSLYKETNEAIDRYCLNLNDECKRLNMLAKHAGACMTEDDYFTLLSEKTDLCCTQIIRVLQGAQKKYRNASPRVVDVDDIAIG